MAALSAFAACFTAPARAEIVPVLSGSPVSDGSGGFLWTYNVSLTGPEQIVASVGPGFGTLYDIGPATFVSSTGLLSTAFTFNFSYSDPPATFTMPTDDPLLLNIRFIDTSVDIGPDTFLGTFTISSPFDTSRLTSFDGQSVKINPGQPDDNTPVGNAGLVQAPAVMAAPVPATLPLLASGIGLICLIAWPKDSRRRRRSVFAGD